MILLCDEPIDVAPLLAAASKPEAGAVVMFQGITREFTAGKQTTLLNYDAYRSMAANCMAELEAAARKRWPLVECNMVHRLGEVGIGEASVVIVVSSPHRQVAFEAAQWLIDTLKRDVPIWKQEHYRDGTLEWVHPGAPPSANNACAT